MTDETLGQLIRRVRKARGLTQTELADAAGISQRWVSDVERGESKMPRIPAMHRIAVSLEIDVAQLFIAAKVAQNKVSAGKIIEEFPPSAEPILDLVVEQLRALSEDELRSVLAFTKVLKR